MKNSTKLFRKVAALFVSILMVLNMTVVSIASEATIDAKMYWTNDLSADWKDTENTGADAIFNVSDFEPGSEVLRYIKIENAGDMAFSYDLKFVSDAANEMASAIDVYYKTDVSANTDILAMDKVGALSQVINGDALSAGYISPEGSLYEGFAEKESIIAVALKMHSDADASFMGKSVDFDIQLIAKDANKFSVKFENTDKYLYRVGNGNAVYLSSLFEAMEGAEIGNVSVDIQPLDESIGVFGTYTPDSSNWASGKIQFQGTGPVAVTISDDAMAIPVTLNLEVVDADNATSATSATDKNIVLLNNISGGFTVSNGYAVYGNGFKVACSGNGSYGSKALSYGFITVDNGILDNVKVICDIFPASYLYTSEMTADSSNRYPYAYSAVAATGSSTISNCYIYGARNNILIGTGDVTVENTVTECGSLSNIQIKGTDANTVTLDNVTTIQYQTTSNYDTSKKVLGFGVVVGDNESVSNSKIKLKGDLRQYNWVTSEDTSVSNTYAKAAISSALNETNYQHTINGTTAVNMGIAYLNDKTATIIDERDNKNDIQYVLKNITMSYGIVTATGQVYSLSKSSVTPDSRYNAETDGVIPYMPSTNGYILPTVAFGGSQNDSLSLDTTYNTTKGMWESKLTVDLDTIDGGSYAFKFTDLKPQKYGKDLDFTVKDSDGNTVDKNTAITLNELHTSEYTLVITDNLLFDANGEKQSETLTSQIPFVLYATKTSIDPPEFTKNTSAIGAAYRLVNSAGGEWRPAYPALNGVSVSYWSASEKKTKTVELTTIYNSGTIKSNVWTYTCDDYTLTITGGAVHSDGTPITPVVANNTLYFVSTNKAFGTGTTTRNIILTYVFTDKNESTKWDRTEKVTYGELGEYSYNSFVNDGELKELSSGGSGGCFAADTLITLADGSQKRIDELTFDDDILVWDFFNGEYTTSKPALLIDDGVKDYDIITLNFDDGSYVRVIYEHGFFDVVANDYVYINKDNVHEFVGHTFIKNDANTNKEVKLTGYEVTNENIGCHTILTAQHNNCIANGLLTVTPPPIDGFYDYFEIGEDMKYDAELMAEDIQKYGLYTYEDFEDYISYEEFVAFNGAYLKLPVSKGYFTFEDILEQIQVFGVGNANDAEDDIEQIMPLDETDETDYIMPLATIAEPTTDTVVSANNTIAAATYIVSVSADNATLTNGTYVIGSDAECVFTLNASGATTGYAMLGIDGESYYTVQIADGEPINIAFKNAKDRAVAVTSFWGNSADYGAPQDSLIASGDELNFGFYIAAIQNGASGADAVFVNNTNDDVTADLYVAVYDANGKMENCVRTNETILSKDDYTYESKLAIPEGGYAKAFAWKTNLLSPWIDLFSTK